MIDKSKLKELALAATPGPWRFYKAPLRPQFPVMVHEIQKDGSEPIVSWGGFDGLKRAKSKITADVRYIAAANPAAILELLAEMESARNAALEESAKACEAWGNAKVAKWAGDPEMCEDAKARAWDALQCAAAIRALATTTSTEPAAPATADVRYMRNGDVKTWMQRAWEDGCDPSMRPDPKHYTNEILEEIADLRAELASRCGAQGGNTCETCNGVGMIGGFQGGGAPGYVSEDCPACASPAPSAKQEPSELTDEQIDGALEGARERIVEGFGYKYNEDDLFAAIRSLAAPSASASPAATMADRYEAEEGLREAVSDFRKATYEFAGKHDPDDHARMMEAQMRIFTEARALAGAAPVVPQSVRNAVARMCQPLDESRLSGATAMADAFCMGIIKEFIDSLSAAPVAGSQQVVPGQWFTEAQLVAAARALADQHATVCNVDKGDNWKFHGEAFLSDAHTVLSTALAAAPAVPVAANGLVRHGDVSSLEITLRQAEALVEFFGGHDGEVSVIERHAAWADQPEGLYAYCTDYPDEGSQYLGPTEVDEELAANGRVPTVPVPVEPALPKQAVREVIGDMYLRMQKSYMAEPMRRITFMDMEAVHEHVKRLGLGGCLDAAAAAAEAMAAPSPQQGKEGEAS